MKATFLKGVALGAVVSLATLMATAAFAGTGVGGVFNLGAINSVNAGTGVSGSTNGNMLGVRNTNTGANAVGIGISVAAGKAPLTVNSATQVKNLNANYLQGKKASQFVNGTGSTHGGIVTVPDTGFTGLGALGGFGGLYAYCGTGGFLNAGIQLDTTKDMHMAYSSSDLAVGFTNILANEVDTVAFDSDHAIETIQFASGAEVATAVFTWGYHTPHTLVNGCDFSFQIVDSIG